MMHAHSRGKEQNKGIKGGSYAERKAFWQRRHALLEEWVDRYEVIDRELACARLGWARTSSNLNLAGLLLHRLTKRGWFNEWRQEDVVYYVTLKIHLRSKDEQKQLMHRHMGARRAALFEMNWQQDFYTYLNGRECWIRSGTIVPDDAWLIGTSAIFCEDETGRSRASLNKARKKVHDYWTQREMVKRTYGITGDFWVLWNCKDPTWIEKIALEVRELPKDAWQMFLFVDEAKLDLFNPFVLRKPLFLVPHDMQYHHILED